MQIKLLATSASVWHAELTLCLRAGKADVADMACVQSHMTLWAAQQRLLPTQMCPAGDADVVPRDLCVLPSRKALLLKLCVCERGTNLSGFR